MFKAVFLARSQATQASSIDWGMIGAVIGFISVVATLAIGIAQLKAVTNPSKSIKCVIISTAPLLKVNYKFKNDLQVFFRGQVITDATFIILKVYNSGKTPITSNDFIKPITFIFSPESEILNAEILKTDPENIGADISMSKNTIELCSLLMNSKDSIDISVLVTEFNNTLDVYGRIIGIRKIQIDKEFNLDNNKTEILQLLFLNIIIGSLVALIGSYFSVKNDDLMALFQGILNYFGH